LHYGFAQILESIGCGALEFSTDSREGLSIDALRQEMEHDTIRAVLGPPNFSSRSAVG
jgi:DNA-binding transcriptional MocR family regulator